jgi:hypothetical protein
MRRFDLNNLSIGSKVRHESYGYGIISDISRNILGETIYHVDFPFARDVLVLDKIKLHPVDEKTDNHIGDIQNFEPGEKKEDVGSDKTDATFQVPVLNMDETTKNGNIYSVDSFKSDTDTKRRKDNEQSDAVNHPGHYNVGNIEVIDYIESLGLATGFNLGNAIKYLSRAGLKKNNSAKQDVEKALWYLRRQYEDWGNGKAELTGAPNNRQLNCYEYIKDKEFSYFIGRVIELIDDAIYCDYTGAAMDELLEAINILEASLEIKCWN